MNYLRKKLQGIMTCSDFEGYLRTISGAPPLTLPYSLGKDITSLTLTGNAVQNGTPSPDNPVEVQGCGEKTGNLFDVEAFVAHLENNAITGGTHEIVELDGEMVLKYDGYGLYDSSGQTGDFFAVSCDANTQYTFSCTFKGSGATWLPDTSSILDFRFEYNDGTYGACTIKNTANWTKIAFTTAADKTLSAIYAYRYNATYAYIKDISLLKGDYTAETAPDYEPYGYKVPVKVGGINLFDVAQITDSSVITRDGDKLILNTYACQSQLSPEDFLEMTGLQPGDTITTVRDISAIKGAANSITGSIMCTNLSDGSSYRIINAGQLYVSTIPDDFDSLHYSKLLFHGTATPDENGDRIAEMSNIMIVKGTYTTDTMPPFEPYHEPQTVNVYTDKPLYGLKLDPTSTGYYTYMDADGNKYLGDTITIDFDNRTATRTDNLIYASLAGKSISYYASSPTESKGLYVGSFRAGGKTHYIDTDGVDKTWGRKSIMCTSLPTDNNPSAPAISTGTIVGDWAGMIKVWLPKSEVDAMTGDTIKDQLTVWWAENMQDCRALYITEPTTTDISDLQDWDAFPSTWRGTVVISADTTIQPSSMAAQYYATKKED